MCLSGFEQAQVSQKPAESAYNDWIFAEKEITQYYILHNGARVLLPQSELRIKDSLRLAGRLGW